MLYRRLALFFRLFSRGGDHLLVPQLSRLHYLQRCLYRIAQQFPIVFCLSGVSQLAHVAIGTAMFMQQNPGAGSNKPTLRERHRRRRQR